MQFFGLRHAHAARARFAPAAVAHAAAGALAVGAATTSGTGAHSAPAPPPPPSGTIARRRGSVRVRLAGERLLAPPPYSRGTTAAPPPPVTTVARRRNSMRLRSPGALQSTGKFSTGTTATFRSIVADPVAWVSNFALLDLEYGIDAAPWTGTTGFNDAALTATPIVGIVLTAGPVAFASTFNGATLSRPLRIVKADAWISAADFNVALLGKQIVAEPSVEADLLEFLRLRLPCPVVLNAAEEGAVAPYVVLSSSHDPTLNLIGDVIADHITFTLSCWARSALEAEAIADTIEAILPFFDNIDPVKSIRRDGGFDHQATMDVSIITADRWV